MGGGIFEKRKGKGDKKHVGTLSYSGDTSCTRKREIVDDGVLGESRSQFCFRNRTLPAELGGCHELFVEHMVTVEDNE